MYLKLNLIYLDHHDIYIYILIETILLRNNYWFYEQNSFFLLINFLS